jgi:hypothetical protein
MILAIGVIGPVQWLMWLFSLHITEIHTKPVEHKIMLNKSHAFHHPNPMETYYIYSTRLA